MTTLDERLRTALADRYRIDLPSIRRELAAAVNEITPIFSIRVTTGVLLDALSADPEIARLYGVLYQSDTPEYARTRS